MFSKIKCKIGWHNWHIHKTFYVFDPIVPFYAVLASLLTMIGIFGVCLLPEGLSLITILCLSCFIPAIYFSVKLNNNTHDKTCIECNIHVFDATKTKLEQEKYDLKLEAINQEYLIKKDQWINNNH